MSDAQVVEAPPLSEARPRSRLTHTARTIVISLIGPIVFIVAWQAASGSLIDAFILPPPTAVLNGGFELLQSGALQEGIVVSMARIIVGWLMGSLIALPIGMLVGAFRMARQVMDPFVHFFRFVPAIALITLFILWFGVGEESKVALIAYAAGFIVLVNTATGVSAIPSDKLDAARCLGAHRGEIFLYVMLPATVPYVLAGMRLALASAFVVIVGAEIIAANSGLGYLVWTSRLYFRVDWVFAGVIVIGILGFLTDRVWGWLGRRLLGRYLRQAGRY